MFWVQKFYKELVFIANLEEKVKAFLSDEKKTKAIAQDEIFLGKVADNTITDEEISQKLEEVGLPLNTDEAKGVKETAFKALNTPLEKLGEVELKNISGGDTYYPYHIGLAGMTIGGVSGVLGLGCWVAGKICASEAHKAVLAGKTSTSEQLTKAQKGLDIATATCLGVAGVGGIGGKIIFDQST